MATIIKDQNLVRVGKPVMPDSRKRVVLPKTVVQEGITYKVLPISCIIIASGR